MKNSLLTWSGALKTYGLMAGGFILVATAVGIFAASPAIAQAVRAALVSNVDDSGRIPYQSLGFCSFSNSTTCSAFLPVVPAGKRLVITHVSGRIRENLPIGNLIMPQLYTVVGAIDLLATFQGNDGANNFLVNQQVLGFWDPGQFPNITVAVGQVADSSSYANFLLTGYMLDCSTGPCSPIAH